MELIANPKTEAAIHDKFFRQFLREPEVHLIKNWMGWSFRTKTMNSRKSKPTNHTPQTTFYREFDIARLEKDNNGKLIIRGYEVKGYTNKDEPITPPRFAVGIGQAISLLLQGADYSYMILPEEKERKNMEGLKLLCDQYARSVGIVYVKDDFSMHWVEREPEPNPFLTTKRKIELAEGAKHPNCDETTDMPLWLKQADYEV